MRFYERRAKSGISLHHRMNTRRVIKGYELLATRRGEGMLVADSGYTGPRIRFVVLVVIDWVGKAVLAVVLEDYCFRRHGLCMYVTLKADDKSLAGERRVVDLLQISRTARNLERAQVDDPRAPPMRC